MSGEHSTVGLIEEMFEVASTAFKMLETRLVNVEISERSNYQQEEALLQISAKTKVVDSKAGPVDAIRVVIDSNLNFKVYVYLELVEDGKLTSPESIASLVILKKMNDKSIFICKGIPDYSSYKQSIGYDSKSVVYVDLPSDTVRHVNCLRISERSEKQRVFICHYCSSLKTYLLRQKRKRHSNVSNHDERQGTSSNHPIEYLSPLSKDSRLKNILKENKLLKGMLRRNKNKQSFQLELNDEQSEEMSELVNAISSSKEASDELEKIFTEAEEDKGIFLRNCWEEDAVERLNVAGKKGNRWSPVTIRLSLAVYTRSPSAFRALRSLKILQLPCERTVKSHMNNFRKNPGINSDAIRHSALMYEEHKTRLSAQGKLLPLGEGVLMWDETKV
jgi:hypothetical protein